MAAWGGVAKNVELVVTRPNSDVHEAFARSLGVLDLLAAGRRATPDLLGQVGVDGALVSLSDGWLTGWLRPRTQGSEEAVSLLIDGELAARRILPAGTKAPRTAEGARSFKFFAANLVRLGYGNGGEISVRLSGTNVPLRGGLLSVGDVERNLRYDVQSDAWVKERTAPRTMLRSAALRVRTRLRPDG
jgi:hypothetical protein